MKYTHHVDTSHSTIVMVTYLSCNGRWFGFKIQLFSKYLPVTRFFSCQQLRELSQQQQLWYHFVFKVNFEKGFPPPKIVCSHLTQWFWYPFKLFLLLHRFSHAQKIIISIAVYWKACDISWKWYIVVNICLFSHFNLTFYISQQQGTLQKLKSTN